MELKNNSYINWLESIKLKIRSAQLKAAVAVNSELLEVYWQLCKEIIQKQSHAQSGNAILEQLSIDLKTSFSSISGFSKRNLYAIRQWYLFYNQQFAIVPKFVAQLQSFKQIKLIA